MTGSPRKSSNRTHDNIKDIDSTALGFQLFHIETDGEDIFTDVSGSGTETTPKGGP